MHNHTRLIGRMTISGLAASGMLHAQDFPDPYFVDSNGDGIDGELNQAIFVAPPPLGNSSMIWLYEALMRKTVSTMATVRYSARWVWCPSARNASSGP